MNMYMCRHTYMYMSVGGYMCLFVRVCVYMYTQEAEVGSVSNNSYFQANI